MTCGHKRNGPASVGRVHRDAPFFRRSMRPSSKTVLANCWIDPWRRTRSAANREILRAHYFGPHYRFEWIWPIRERISRVDLAGESTVDTIAVCATEPIAVEGLRSLLEAAGRVARLSSPRRP